MKWYRNIFISLIKLKQLLVLASFRLYFLVFWTLLSDKLSDIFSFLTTSFSLSNTVIHTHVFLSLLISLLSNPFNKQESYTQYTYNFLSSYLVFFFFFSKSKKYIHYLRAKIIKYHYFSKLLVFYHYLKNI